MGSGAKQFSVEAPATARQEAKVQNLGQGWKVKGQRFKQTTVVEYRADELKGLNWGKGLNSKEPRIQAETWPKSCIAYKKYVLIWCLSSPFVVLCQQETTPAWAFKLSIKLEAPGAEKSWGDWGRQRVLQRRWGQWPSAGLSCEELHWFLGMWFLSENCTHSPNPHGADIFLPLWLIKLCSEWKKLLWPNCSWWRQHYLVFVVLVSHWRLFLKLRALPF